MALTSWLPGVFLRLDDLYCIASTMFGLDCEVGHTYEAVNSGVGDVYAHTHGGNGTNVGTK